MIRLEAPRDRREEALALAARYKAANVRVFGSVAHGGASQQCDVDLLLRFQPGASLFDLIGLQHDAAELPHTAVDVVAADALSPYLVRRILGEAVPP